MQRSGTLFTLLMVLSTASAQNWTGALNADWNNPGNWTDWPLDGEDITVDPAAYSGAQASPSITAASVFAPDRMYVMNGAALVIAANLVVDNRLIVSDEAEVTMTGGTLTSDRLIMELGGHFTLAGGTVNTLSVLALGDDGATASSFVQNGGTVNASGEFGFDMEVGPGNPFYELNSGVLTVNGDALWFGATPGSGQGILRVNAGTAQINGSVMNTVGSTVDVLVEVDGGSLTVNGPGIDLAHATDSIVLSGGAFHVDGDCVLQNDGIWHAIAGDTYFDQQAELRGVGSYLFHDLTISSGASLRHSDPAEILVGGNWIAMGPFDPDANTVAFVGAAGQTVAGTAFHGLRVANTGAGLFLSGPSSLAGPLLLESGLVHTQTNDLLTALDGSTATGGSATSYVNGPMRKVGENQFVFPVGRNGQWRRLGISSINDQDTEYTVEYFDTPYVNTTSLGPGVDAVSMIEHWTLTRGVTTDDAQVELFWEDASASGISDCATLSICYWDGSAWQGMVSTTSGACTGNNAGSVKSDASAPVYQAVTFGVNDGSIGMLELSSAGSLTVFPNPASDRFTVQGVPPNTFVEVLDPLGQRILATRDRSIDISAWAPGLYFVKAGGRTERIVKQQ